MIVQTKDGLKNLNYKQMIEGNDMIRLATPDGKEIFNIHNNWLDREGELIDDIFNSNFFDEITKAEGGWIKTQKHHDNGVTIELGNGEIFELTRV